MTEAGHNSAADQRLRSIVERIVRLNEEKKAISEDIKEIYQEAKSSGYDLPALRIVVKEEMEDDAKRAKREEARAIADTMLAAIGPLGEAAVGRRAA